MQFDERNMKKIVFPKQGLLKNLKPGRELTEVR
jgi:hypothetical protein